MNITVLQVQISDVISPTSNEFIWQVFVPIMGWLILVLILLFLLIRKYTFGKWTKENPNPYGGETFDLPRGTFRGVLTMSLLYVAIVLELVNVYVQDFEFQMTEFMTAFQMMIAFYFGSKVMHHITAADHGKTKVKAAGKQNVVAPNANIISGVPDFEGSDDSDEEAAG